MSDEKEAAVRRAADALSLGDVRLGWIRKLLDASGVWERITYLEAALNDANTAYLRQRQRIEELEREKDHWQRRYLEAERRRTELAADNERLRAAYLSSVRRIARAALAETQENAE